MKRKGDEFYPPQPRLGYVIDRKSKEIPPYLNAVSQDIGQGGAQKNKPIKFSFTCSEAEMIDPFNCYLKLAISVTLQGDDLFLVDTAAMAPISALFRRIDLVGRCGCVIERIDRFDILSSLIGRVLFSGPFLTNTCSSRQLTESFIVETWNQKTSYLIPFSLLFGLFRCDELLPPQLWDGLTMDLYLNEPDIVVCNLLPQEDVETHSILHLSDISAVLDTYVCDPLIVSGIQNAFLNKGLYLHFQTYTLCIEEDIPTPEDEWDEEEDPIYIPTFSRELEIRDSFTNATKIIVTARACFPQPWMNLLPSFSTCPYPRGLIYQLRFNGVNYPDQPVKTFIESYFHWMQAWGKNRMFMQNQMASEQEVSTARGYYQGSVGPAIAFDLNRNPFSITCMNVAANFSANPLLSGQRIDGTNPARISFKNTVKQVINRPVETDIKGLTRLFYRVFVWVEHQNVLVLKPDGITLFK